MRERKFTPRDPRSPRTVRLPRGGGRRGASRQESPKPERAPDGRVILYGWHTVKAALENPARRIRRLYLTENAARRLADDGVVLPVEPELIRPDAIAARLGPDAVHQG